MSGDMCVGCHGNNGDDGTFGGDPGSFGYFDMNQLVHADTEADLVDYLEVAMPPAAPDNCGRECATQAAAYLWTFYDEDVAAANREAAKPAAIARGSVLMNEGTLCAGCHRDNKNGTFGASENTYFDVDSMRNADSEDGLADYIHVSMPPDPSGCEDDCATDIAAYLWSLRDDEVVPFGGMDQ